MEDAILSFLHRTREPGVLTEDEVYLMLACVAEASVALPEVDLSSRERMSLCGQLFLEAPVIVDAVVDGVRRAPPGLFAEFGVDIEDLHQRTMRGRALRGLAYVLRGMAQRAEDLAILDDSSAIKDAMKLLRSALVRGRLPGSIEDRRRLYLRAAVYYWERDQARRRRAALASRPRRPAGDPADPGGEAEK